MKCKWIHRLWNSNDNIVISRDIILDESNFKYELHVVKRNLFDPENDLQRESGSKYINVNVNLEKIPNICRTDLKNYQEDMEILKYIVSIV